MNITTRFYTFLGVLIFSKPTFYGSYFFKIVQPPVFFQWFLVITIEAYKFLYLVCLFSLFLHQFLTFIFYSTFYAIMFLICFMYFCVTLFSLVDSHQRLNILWILLYFRFYVCMCYAKFIFKYVARVQKDFQKRPQIYHRLLCKGKKLSNSDASVSLVTEF